MVRLLALLCIASIVGCAAPSNQRSVSYTLPPLTQKAKAPETKIERLLRQAQAEQAKFVPEWKATIVELQDIPQGELTSRQRSDLYEANRNLKSYYETERRREVMERYKN